MQTENKGISEIPKDQQIKPLLNETQKIKSLLHDLEIIGAALAYLNNMKKIPHISQDFAQTARINKSMGALRIRLSAKQMALVTSCLFEEIEKEGDNE